VNQQHPQVGVAALSDSEVPLFVAAGMLSGHQSDPCRKLPPIMEGSSICNGRYHGCCRDWANAFHGSDLPAERIASMNPLDLILHFLDALFQRAQLFVESGQKLSPQIRSIVDYRLRSVAAVLRAPG
jgi:hypothetical protein